MKTLQELEALSDNELRVMLAETQGWIRVGPDVVPDRVWPCKSYVTGKDGNWMMFPPAGLDWGNAGISTGKCAASPSNYPADLNACHAVVHSLLPFQQEDIAMKINDMTRKEHMTRAQSLAASMFVKSRLVTIALILTLQPQ